MASVIKIKRSQLTATPTTLADGELAYSSNSTSQKLFVGWGGETTPGQADNISAIGGKYFTDMMDHTAGTLTANSGLIVDDNKAIDTLYIGNEAAAGGKVYFNEATDSGSNTVSLKAPNYIPASFTLTLPDADGTSGQFLQTDGSGGLSFASVATTLSDLGVTSTASELNKLDGFTGSTSDLNVLSGTSMTSSKLNVLAGVTSTAAELNLLDGATVTTAELNILDGVTATATEINKLDGLVSTTTELNILSGVTVSATEINKLSGLTPSTTELNILDGATITTAELNILDGVTATFSEINKLDGLNTTTTELNLISGLTANSTELNVLDGITSTTDELNLLDGATVTTAELNILDGVTANSTEINILDGATVTTAELNILDGVTATAAELNILDGVTSTTAELNILDGVTATAAELNILDGVTATTAELNILAGTTMTNSKLNDLSQVSATSSELNILDGVTATAAELNILDGVTATAVELNVLDGITANTTELNILDGVTATAAELNILDGVTATTAELNYLDVTAAGQTQASKVVTTNAQGQVTFNGNVSFASTYSITNLPNPTNNGDAANKAYVDAAATGFVVKDPVRVATTADLSATYDNGTLGVGATLTAGSTGAISIDGVSLSSADRVLVKNQTTESENGIYTVTTVGDVSTAFVLTRATPSDEGDELTGGTFVFVEEGSLNADNGYVFSHSGTPTMGTTALPVSQFSAAGTVIAGDALVKTGSEIDVKYDNSTIGINGSNQLYVKDSSITNAKLENSGFTVSAGSSGSIALGSTLSFSGATPISASLSGSTVTISASDATTSAKGIASFSSDNFTVASGAVSITEIDGGTF